MVIFNWTLRNKLQWNFTQNTKLFIHEDASEYVVWEKAAILSRGRWIKQRVSTLLWKGTVDCHLPLSSDWFTQYLGYLIGVGGLWGFLWWAPSAKRKDHHGVSSGWSSVWHCSNTGLSSSQYEQISIILWVWPFCLTPFFRSITFWRAYG